MTKTEQAWQQTDPLQAPNKVLYLDTVRATATGQIAIDKSLALLQLGPGGRILDLGCGTGDDVTTVAQHVGAQGMAVGVDYSREMLAEADSRARDRQLPVAFCQADAHRLCFADACFDGARAARVVQHLADPRASLAELVRVVRPGGRVVVGEPDWETLVVDAGDRQLTRRILNFICDHRIRNGWIGRQLASLYRDVGLTDIESECITGIIREFHQADRFWGFRRNARRAREAGVITPGEQAEWLADLERLDAEGRFFSSLSGFLVCGRKS